MRLLLISLLFLTVTKAMADITQLYSYDLFESPQTVSEEFANRLHEQLLIHLDGLMDDIRYYSPQDQPDLYIDQLIEDFVSIQKLNDELACHSGNPVGNSFIDFWNFAFSWVTPVGPEQLQRYGSQTVAASCVATVELESKYWEQMSGDRQILNRYEQIGSAVRERLDNLGATAFSF